MKEWFAKAWHDPVGSKVIAGIILAALSALLIWAKSGFSSNAVVLWSVFAKPMALPFGVVLLVLVACAALIGWLLKERRDHLNGLEAIEEALDASGKTIAAIENSLALTPEKQAEHEKVMAQAREVMEAARVSFAIKTEHMLVMRFLASAYPEPMGIKQLATSAGLLFAATEKICEDIAAEKFLSIITSDHQPMKAVLTKTGRDYLMRGHDWEPLAGYEL
jgi:hypothetical protein